MPFGEAASGQEDQREKKNLKFPHSGVRVAFRTVERKGTTEVPLTLDFLQN
jgi:hypothetical protein